MAGNDCLGHLYFGAVFVWMIKLMFEPDRMGVRNCGFILLRSLVWGGKLPSA